VTGERYSVPGQVNTTNSYVTLTSKTAKVSQQVNRKCPSLYCVLNRFNHLKNQFGAIVVPTVTNSDNILFLIYRLNYF